MSTDAEDREVSQMMERNRRSQLITAIVAVVVVLLGTVAMVMYFANVAANAP